MNINELIEARRSPDLNVGREGHDAAVSFIKGLPQGTYGVTMTELPKLGINPNSRYNTPIGVYFYPADEYVRVKEKGAGSKLVFVDDAPYIQVFEVSGNVLDITNVSSGLYDNLVKQLYSILPTFSKQFSVDESVLKDELDLAVRDANQYANVQSYGGYYWYLLFCLTNKISGGHHIATAHREGQSRRGPVIWNKIFRLLGWAAVIDDGSSIIHENEPTQGVVLDPVEMKLLKTFKNVKDTKKQSFWIDLLTHNATSPIQYIRNVSTQLHLQMPYNDINEKERPVVKQIVNKIVKYMKDDPTVFMKLTDADIKRFIMLAKDPALATWLRTRMALADWLRREDLFKSIQRHLAADKDTEYLKKIVSIMEVDLNTFNRIRAVLNNAPNDERAVQVVSHIDSLLNPLVAAGLWDPVFTN